MATELSSRAGARPLRQISIQFKPESLPSVLSGLRSKAAPHARQRTGIWRKDRGVALGFAMSALVLPRGCALHGCLRHFPALSRLILTSLRTLAEQAQQRTSMWNAGSGERCGFVNAYTAATNRASCQHLMQNRRALAPTQYHPSSILQRPVANTRRCIAWRGRCP